MFKAFSFAGVLFYFDTETVIFQTACGNAALIASTQTQRKLFTGQH